MKGLLIQQKLSRKKQDKISEIGQGQKKKITINKSKEDKDQAFESKANGDKCTVLREDMSL